MSGFLDILRGGFCDVLTTLAGLLEQFVAVVVLALVEVLVAAFGT